MQDSHKEQLKNMAFGCVKSAMPPEQTYIDEDRGTLTVNTFLKINDSMHNVYIYARLESNHKDGAFIIIVDPSEDLDNSAFKTCGHWGDSFNVMYKGKCLYAADYEFGLAFESHQEFVNLQHEYHSK
ncbi:hypothetical protein OCL06_07370 [Alteromonas sp. ASW11-19]|uniref:Uncharacterized protein n=1 Tax=Alteromonas salexigens TaxID=2982530 RepID=A0ABT2VPM6_9ALTE|nr:hypothetical protein [Alteromonas salexigens]MCU7554413.1 hypothetical protein [Alteromonas salexigens]